MNSFNEAILSGINQEFPEKFEEIKPFLEISPPVSEEYLYELCGDDEGMKELFDEMMEYFFRYTRDVCEQESLKQKGIDENLEEIRAKDPGRTMLHNAMIDHVKIFVRNLRSRNKDTSWIENIDNGGRAGYAKLALLMTFSAILKNNQTS